MNNKVFNISKKWLNDSIVNKNEYIQSKLSIIDNLNKFLNSIEINKNYYRTGIHVKNPRYKKKVSDDTLLIKEFKA